VKVHVFALQLAGLAIAAKPRRLIAVATRAVAPNKAQRIILKVSRAAI